MRFYVLPLVAFLALTGCPSGDLSNTCHFQSETTYCGQCIHQYCQPRIDSECANLTRDDTLLAALDACASGKGSCDKVETSYSRSDIGDCIKGFCTAQCVPGATADLPVACNAASDSRCSCVKNGTSTNSTKCPPADSDWGCCASTGYPDSGTCSCTRVVCNVSGSVCNCEATEGQLLPSSGTGEYASCGAGSNWRVCCNSSDGGCDCYTAYDTCPKPGQTQVSSCSAFSNYACADNTTKVPSCR